MPPLRRYIEPEALLAHRFRDRRSRPRWDAAVVCFRDQSGSMALIDAFRAKPLGRKVFWGLVEAGSQPNVYAARAGGLRIGIVARCIWGGPQAAILVEELAALGVRTVIGFGASGGLGGDLRQGAQIVVDRALVTDGTGRAYTRRRVERPDARLLAAVTGAARVAAVTVDAVYRETPALARAWRAAGAQVVNMEAAPFYAAARVCGVAALWVGQVSDLLGRRWHGWNVERREMDEGSIDLCRQALAAVRRGSTDSLAEGEE